MTGFLRLGVVGGAGPGALDAARGWTDGEMRKERIQKDKDRQTSTM